jgi:hypothetical protein
VPSCAARSAHLRLRPVPRLGHLLSGKKRSVALLTCAAALLITAVVAALKVTRDAGSSSASTSRRLGLWRSVLAGLAVDRLECVPCQQARPHVPRPACRPGPLSLVLCLAVAVPFAQASQMAYVTRHDVLGILR